MFSDVKRLEMHELFPDFPELLPPVPGKTGSRSPYRGYLGGTLKEGSQ